MAKELIFLITIPETFKDIFVQFLKNINKLHTENNVSPIYIKSIYRKDKEEVKETNHVY